MDGERGVGEGGAEPEVEDEFACAEVLRRSLASVHGTVQRIFGVAFGMETLDPPAGDGGQMWLKLRGPSGNVRAAKLFVKGVVNQEEQQELSYPEVLHCVFCGARGLFLDSLIRSTSAHIVVGSPGSLLISGLAEPVVGAYSLIADLVARCHGAQATAGANGGSGESLDSRRGFKTLVEEWEDRHTLDLLVLPSPVKGILLDLVKESGLGSRPTDGKVTGGSRGGRRDRTSPGLHSPRGEWTAGLGRDSFGPRGRAEGAEERLSLPPRKVGEEDQLEQGATDGEGVEVLSSMGNKEFWLLLKFFTAMGYTEDVVQRVLARTGPKEASQILDLVQQEQDRSEQEHTPKDEEGVLLNRPCESEHTEEEEEEEAAGASGGPQQVEGATEGPDPAQEEDFVLGVLKRAAASCGYAEHNVAKVYNMLPTRSTHQLLLELQRETSRETDAFREGPREMDDVVLEDEDAKTPDAKEEDECATPAGQKNLPVAEPDLFAWNDEPQRPSPPRTVLPKVKGPPTSIYPSSLDLRDEQRGQDVSWPPPSPSYQGRPTPDSTPTPRSSKQQFLPAPAPPVSRANDSQSPPARARERRAFPTAAASSVVVTGEQRFLEGLQAPFQLKLTDAPGDPKLRTVIIDASNVAMSHGLSHFFSCRGIALAVQHFWDRGHRHISALLPQWRQKSDPKIKEQHYLTELQRVGLLSFTPSREVQGRRIASYDDRLMLQLAQKTNGVIVTNDNLRDLSDESPAWRDIIKKRLLQYTFVGDHFMVPDDPLGRGGPHLDDFLRAEHRSPDPGSHSFAGSASTFPFSGPQRSQTELFNFRDRTLGGASDPVRRGKGRGKGPSSVDRSAEQTAALREQLCQVFPGQDNMVTLVLQCHPVETDVNALSEFILGQQAD